MNPTLKSEAQFPSKPGFYLNTLVVAHIEAVRKRPLWFLMAFDPTRIEKIFGTGNDAIQALGVFEGLACPDEMAGSSGQRAGNAAVRPATETADATGLNSSVHV